MGKTPAQLDREIAVALSTSNAALDARIARAIAHHERMAAAWTTEATGWDVAIKGKATGRTSIDEARDERRRAKSLAREHASVAKKITDARRRGDLFALIDLTEDLDADMRVVDADLE